MSKKTKDWPSDWYKVLSYVVVAAGAVWFLWDSDQPPPAPTAADLIGQRNSQAESICYRRFAEETKLSLKEGLINVVPTNNNTIEVTIPARAGNVDWTAHCTVENGRIIKFKYGS